jgi:hypothetical protein
VIRRHGLHRPASERSRIRVALNVHQPTWRRISVRSVPELGATVARILRTVAPSLKWVQIGNVL